MSLLPTGRPRPRPSGICMDAEPSDHGAAWWQRRLPWAPDAQSQRRHMKRQLNTTSCCEGIPLDPGPARHCRANNYRWKSRQSSANCSGSIARQDSPSGKRPSGTRPTVDRAGVLLQFRVQAFAKLSGSGFGVSSQTRVAPGVYQRSEHCYCHRRRPVIPS